MIELESKLITHQWMDLSDESDDMIILDNISLLSRVEIRLISRGYFVLSDNV